MLASVNKGLNKCVDLRERSLEFLALVSIGKTQEEREEGE